ncbi:DUF3531 family protein [Spirulina sp. CS-785/01]|uniref:DUF3531 family protein n=1 Tax=Spirulina sp. CS-785/01 TaxID=3021716 RepID=UPI00232D5838|nr:DUF3531 family protein [Spirulina sp. CS-785/01]MDB9315268.1 DUF3531 family protein [Spirulina sp. CS-785/01]
MDVQFREFNPFDLWIWLEFENSPSPMEQQYIEELFNSWFFLGKLGGFNAENLQVMETGIDISYMDYNDNYETSTMMAPMHNMGEFEYLEFWGRCWFDLGTSDLIAVDILINALTQLSHDYVPIRRVIFGGENEGWPVGKQSQAVFN